MNTFCLLSSVGHNSEKRDKESSLSSGHINEPFSAVDKATLEEAVRTGNKLDTIS